MSLHWYACISMNIYYYKIYYISSEIVWQELSNISSIVWICLAVYNISANRTFTITNGLISQLFVVAFIYPDNPHLGLFSTTYIVTNSLLLFYSKVYIHDILNLCCYVVSLYYNSKIIEYIGHWKILELISQNY